MLVLFHQYFKWILHENFQPILSSYCVVPENIHIPPTEGIENFWRVGGSQRVKNLSKYMKLDWGGGQGKIPSVGVVQCMDNFWCHTFYWYNVMVTFQEFILLLHAI